MNDRENRRKLAATCRQFRAADFVANFTHGFKKPLMLFNENRSPAGEVRRPGERLVKVTAVFLVHEMRPEVVLQIGHQTRDSIGLRISQGHGFANSPQQLLKQPMFLEDIVEAAIDGVFGGQARAFHKGGRIRGRGL